MLIINADDWGASTVITNAILKCAENKSVTSVSAMVFMEDSLRAADIVKSENVDTGLHLNFSQPFTDLNVDEKLGLAQSRLVSWLRSHKVAQVLYNPFLRSDFEYVFNSQVEEYCRIYNEDMVRIDGHNHMHLCANMLIDNYIPRGVCVRKDISFFREEKKNIPVKILRAYINTILEKRYICTDYFFHIRQINPSLGIINRSILEKIIKLANDSVVELLVHPSQKLDNYFLVSDLFGKCFGESNLQSFRGFLYNPCCK